MPSAQLFLLILCLTASLTTGFAVIPGLNSSPSASLVNRAATAPSALPDQARESICGYINLECDWTTGFEGAGKDACVSARNDIFHEDACPGSLCLECHDHELSCGMCFCTCGPS